MSFPRISFGPLVAMLLALATWPLHGRAAEAAGNAQAGAAKAAACSACHGAKGISAVPTFPDLAGQSVAFLSAQLQAYKSGSRKDPMMSAAVASLGRQDLDDLAAYFASLPPKPAGHADASSRGGVLYLQGDPAKGIPACQGCHGPAGQGPQPHGGATQTAWAAYPRVAGQPQPYLVKVLTEYKQGALGGEPNAKVMQGVMQSIDASDIQALAAYITTQ